MKDFFIRISNDLFLDGGSFSKEVKTRVEQSKFREGCGFVVTRVGVAASNEIFLHG